MTSAPQNKSARAPRPGRVLALQDAWSLSAWIAAVFAGLVALTLLVTHFTSRVDDPLHSQELKALKAKLQTHPNDEQLKTQIRQMDLELRRRFFHSLAQDNAGVYLLLGGTVVFIVAATQTMRGQKRLLKPKPELDAAEKAARAARLARWSVAGAGTAVGCLLFALSFGRTIPLSQNGSRAELDLAPGTAGDVASLDELRQNWPRFRGVDGGGVSPSNSPAAWDGGSGAGILWKIPAPAAGFNSPIVWGNNLFLSGGDAAERAVFCFDTGTGRLLWRQPVANAPFGSGRSVAIPESTGYAASTTATDGRRVYAIFATGELACFSLDGKALWMKNFGPLKNLYGHATSLATWKDRLLLQLDQGEPDAGQSKLYALDGRTGQTLWQRPRRAGNSWASPIVIEAGGKAQVITLAVPSVIAYSANDGAELWRVEGLNGEITPSPIFAAGLVFAISPTEKVLAIRPEGTGDVTKTHVAWTAEDNVPDITSPVCDGERLFTLSSGGVLTCYGALDGKKQWEHDFELEFNSSPAIAGGRLYLFGLKGAAIVVETGAQFKEVSRTQMPDEFRASPAIAAGKMFMRGTTNVWCFGQQPTNLANRSTAHELHESHE